MSIFLHNVVVLLHHHAGGFSAGMVMEQNCYVPLIRKSAGDRGARRGPWRAKAQ